MKKLTCVLLFLLSAYFVFADVRLPAVIGNNMVLQQNAPVDLWGWSDAAEKIFVTTSWNNKTDSTIGTRDAKWRLKIQTPPAGGPYTIIIRGKNTNTLTTL